MLTSPHDEWMCGLFFETEVQERAGTGKNRKQSRMIEETKGR
jgi:hypothetical protein